MTRVLLVDDESLTRETLRDYLRLDSSLHVVGEAADGQVAIRQTVTLRPDLILMDMQMPILDGVGATAKIHAECPDVKILGLTTFATDRYVVDLLRAGASGYIVKDTKPRDLIAAIHTVLAGESALSPEVTKYVIKGLEASVPAVVPPNQDLLDKLTEKEMEVIRLLAQVRRWPRWTRCARSAASPSITRTILIPNLPMRTSAWRGAGWVIR